MATIQRRPQFFENQKRGEVNELKELLKNSLGDKDQKKRQEVVKKIIAFMTLGVDVSKLFGEMCMASFTNDLITKKMIYLYLSNYAESHPDLAIMAINTFLKDCQHVDGKIRGLALRNLCSLRFSGSFEYLMPAILEALSDNDAYVKKTAIIGVIKVHLMNPEAVQNANLVDKLYELVRDVDTNVISNAIQAINEIQMSEGGIVLSSKLMVYLLNRIKEFNEWGQMVVLDLAAKYQPKSESEQFDIMNLLEERLANSNSTIVLGVIKVFLNYSANNKDLYLSVVDRVCVPLITLMTSSETSGSFELTYTILTHIHFIVTRGGNVVFSQEYKQFYSKMDEPTYIKHLKLKILSQLAVQDNIGDILNELGVYVQDVNQDISKKSIQALGEIALNLPEMCQPILKQITSFIKMEIEYITNQSIITFKDILRKFQNDAQEILDVIPQAIDLVTDNEAKVALIWILGELGESLDDSPYILENYVNGLKDDKHNNDIKNTLLNSSIRLFLKRPPEMQKILGKLLKLIIENEDEDIDLRERAVFYYRGLQKDVNLLIKLVDNDDLPITQFMEDSQLMKDNSSIEFNTLSVVYNKSENKFIKQFDYFKQQKKNEQESNQEPDKQTNQNKVTEQTVQNDDLLDVDVVDNSINQNQNTIHNLLDLSPSMTQIQITDLTQNFQLEADSFQQMWEDLNEGAQIVRFFEGANMLTEQNVEIMFNNERVYCVASGEMDYELKFYLYAQYMHNQKIMIMELQINKQTTQLSLCVKCDDDDLASFFCKYIEGVFNKNGIV